MPPKSEWTTSVIIVTWNSEKFIGDCIESIYRHSDRDRLEILVVDNASTDRTVRIVKERFPAANLIETGSNLGFPKANNIGILQSRGRYLLLLNPDTRFESDVVSTLSEFLEKNRSAGAAGPKIIESNGTVNIFSARQLPSLSGSFFLHFGLRKLFPNHPVFAKETIPSWDRSSVRRVPYLNGAGIMLRKTDGGQLPYLSEKLPMYYEDIELSARIQQNGNRLYCVPEAVITHLGSRSSDQFPSRSWLYALENAQAPWLYILEFHGRAKARLFEIIVLSANFLRCMILLLPYLILGYLSPRKTHTLSIWLKKAFALVIWGLSNKNHFSQKASAHFSVK